MSAVDFFLTSDFACHIVKFLSYVSECLIGRFGDACAEECHCADKLSCDRKSGLCGDDVCEPGWKGDACNKGIEIHVLLHIGFREKFCWSGTLVKVYCISFVAKASEQNLLMYLKLVIVNAN